MVNITTEMMLSGPQNLAIAYAPKVTRDRLGWLLLFDQRLHDVQQRTRESLMAQMRFAWWREMLAKPVEERPKGEPLLAALAEVEQEGLLKAALALVDAWELSIGDADQGASIHSAQRRADAIFLSYAGWVGSSFEEQETAKSLGHCWVGALPDGDALKSKSRKLRPLSILALAAHLERRGGRANGLRLIWHALTGR